MPRPGLHDYAKLVSMPVQRRLFSILAGIHRGENAGTSHEFLDMAEYKVGDDISDIDWKTSARMGHPVVKRFESAAVLSVYLVVDSGANMAALASGGMTKKQVADEFSTAIAWLTAMRGDLLGLVVGNSQKVRAFPARSGLTHAETVLRVANGGAVSDPPPGVPQLLRRLDTTLQHRSMILLVTDQQQITPEVWRPLRRLLTRHRVGVLLVNDLDPTRAGAEDRLADVQAGAIPDFVKNDPTIAHQWAIALREQRRRSHELLATLRIPFAEAGSEADILPALVQILEGGETHGRAAS